MIDAVQGQFCHIDEHAQRWPCSTTDTYMQLHKRMFREDHYRSLRILCEHSEVIKRYNPDGSVTNFLTFADSLVGDTQEHPELVMSKKLNYCETAICAKCCVRSEDVVRPL